MYIHILQTHKIEKQAGLEDGLSAFFKEVRCELLLEV